MSTEQVISTSATAEVPVAKHAAIHPLSPLTASEIRGAARLTRSLYAPNAKLQFKAITLEEPEKARLVPFLEAEHSARRLPSIDRKAFVSYYLRNTVSEVQVQRRRKVDIKSIAEEVHRISFMKPSSI